MYSLEMASDTLLLLSCSEALCEELFGLNAQSGFVL